VIFLLSLYITIILLKLYNEKEKDSREVLIENLSFRLVREEDLVAEMYLKRIEPYIENDVKLKELLKKEELSSNAIREYIQKKYFVGYLSRYELQVVPCWPEGDVVIRGTGETYNCYSYFDELITGIGYSVNSSKHFYFMDNNQWKCYLSSGIVQLFLPADPATIEVNPRIVDDKIHKPGLFCWGFGISLSLG